nr:hypothetical protein [Tanacetum cinerariifolium]
MMWPDHQDPKEGCNRDAKSRYSTRLAQLLPRHIYSPCVVNWDVLNRIRCDGEIDDMLRIRLREARSDEEIFTSLAWIRAFNINEPIYAELCYEFYSTYEFDEVCADDELQTKKIIKFRLGGHAHSLTLLEFLEGGRSRCIPDSVHSLLLRKKVNKELGKVHWWEIVRGRLLDAAKDHMIYRVLLLSLQRGCDEEFKHSDLFGDLDTITLRDLIDSNGKLIPEDPQLGVPRVGIPRPSRESMQDLYDRMGRMEIRQEAIDGWSIGSHITGIVVPTSTTTVSAATAG